MDKALAVMGAVFLVVIGLLGLSLLLAWPLSLAWNYVMPYLFGLKQIGVLQAWALAFVTGTLIKSSVSK